MNDRELMQQALDALENSVDLVREDAYQAEKLYGNYPTRQGKVNGLKVLADDHEKAITALTERLAQPEQEPVPENFMDALKFDVAARDAREWERVDMREHAEGNLGIGTAPPAQPAMFGPMGTVGALFDKHVIGRLDKNWRVYVEKNT
jgi:hypothetical protein